MVVSQQADNLVVGRWLGAAALSWPRFMRAQTPAVLLAVLLGGAVAGAAQEARAAHLGGTAVLLAGGLTAATVAFMVWRVRSSARHPVASAVSHPRLRTLWPR